MAQVYGGDVVKRPSCPS